METNAHKKFRRELRRLVTLYNAVVHAFERAEKDLKKKVYNTDEEYDPKTTVYLDQIESDLYLISGNSYELLNCYKNRFRRYIREVLIIRIVSTLEVFLIETLREIFLSRKDLFQNGKVIDFTYNELLSNTKITQVWSKILNKECRNLQNQGFLEFKKYYLKNMGIDFNRYPGGISFLEQIHDIRHLLVHQLGKIDRQYAHKYNESAKQIRINETDFREYIGSICSFAEYIAAESANLINKTEQKEQSSELLSYFIAITLLDEEARLLFQRDYTFFTNDELVRFSDIAVSVQMNGYAVKMELSGDATAIKEYRKILKRYEKNSFLRVGVNKRTSTHQTEVSDEVLCRVKKLLPPEPFPVDIHKTIARDLGISNSEAYRIIAVIRNTAT